MVATRGTRTMLLDHDLMHCMRIKKLNTQYRQVAKINTRTFNTLNINMVKFSQSTVLA